MDHRRHHHNETDIEGKMHDPNAMDENNNDVSGTIREPLLRNRVNSTSQIAIVGANTCPIESLDYEYDFSNLCIYFFSFFVV